MKSTGTRHSSIHTIFIAVLKSGWPTYPTSNIDYSLHQFPAGPTPGQSPAGARSAWNINQYQSKTRWRPIIFVSERTDPYLHSRRWQDTGAAERCRQVIVPRVPPTLANWDRWRFRTRLLWSTLITAIAVLLMREWEAGGNTHSPLGDGWL